MTFLFMPESAYGPTNNCVGIGEILRRRGHRVVFAAEASWAGKLSALGFEEDLVHLSPPPEPAVADADDTARAGETAEQDPGAFWKEFIRDTAPEFRKPTVEQLETFMAPTWQALIDGARYCEPQLREIIARTRPDVIVEDNVVAFPALTTAGVPYVRIVSCNPLEVPGPDIPPAYSGLPAGDPSQWADFRTEYDRTHRPIWADFDAWCREQGMAGLPDLEFVPTSEHANLYVYPEVADYTAARPLGPTWHRLDSSVRTTDPSVDLPALLTDRPDGSALVYLSLGSLGSADVDLMRRLVGVLGDTPHRYIVSKGPQASEYELAPNMWGAEFLPQTTLLPLVDVVITHGGNNTTTEAFHHGKPMVVLPLFWDQYDNAQRVDETGFGVRLPTYAFEDSRAHRRHRPSGRRHRAAPADGRERRGDPQPGRAHPRRRRPRAGRSYGIRVTDPAARAALAGAVQAADPAVLLPALRRGEESRLVRPLTLVDAVELPMAAGGRAWACLVRDGAGAALGVPLVPVDDAVDVAVGGVRRAVAGDGAATALLGLLDAGARAPFDVVRLRAAHADGERAVDVDQTHDSVVVGGSGATGVVVKWSVHVAAGARPSTRGGRRAPPGRRGFRRHADARRVPRPPPW